jgi:hypothetical protein
VKFVRNQQLAAYVIDSNHAGKIIFEASTLKGSSGLLLRIVSSMSPMTRNLHGRSSAGSSNTEM